MDIVIGIIVWGGLLWLVLAWLTRGSRSATPPRPRQAPSPGRSAGRPGTTPPPPTPRPVGQRPGDQHRDRVDDALVDGLVIGHFLTRDHYERQIGELEDSIDALGDERDRWADDLVMGDEDLEDGTDYAEFDAMGGFGVEPWADEVFDVGDMDDDY